MIRLEKALDECLEHLKSRCQQLHPDTDMSETDDLDSIASGSLGVGTLSLRNRVVRFGGQEREVERLRQKLTRVEQENLALQQQVTELKRMLGHDDEVQQNGEKKKVEDKDASRVELSEGGVWNLVRKLNFSDKT
jgi:hypothetical protein